MPKRRSLTKDVLSPSAITTASAPFIQTLAHEIRTPLQIIQGVAEMMDVGAPLKTLETHILAIRRETARAVTVLNDFSRRRDIEAHGVSLRPTSFDATGVLQELALTVEKYYPGRLEMEYSDELPQVRADPQHLHLILWTLLHNALRVGRARRGPLVRLVVQPNGGTMEFAVHDAGPRLPAKYHDRIFDPFAIVPRQPRFGLGQGLYVARLLARAMRGDLHVKDPDAEKQIASVRKGNIFVLTIPLSEGGL
jgi:signal transduction histidine kinase